MYAKVIKDGFKYISDIGQIQSANRDAIIRIDLKSDWERGTKEGFIKEHDPYANRKPGTITSETLIQPSVQNPAKAEGGPVYPEQGSLVKAEFLNDEDEVISATGEVLVVQKDKQIRVKFQGDNRDFRIIALEDVSEIIGSGE